MVSGGELGACRRLAAGRRRSSGAPRRASPGSPAAPAELLGRLDLLTARIPPWAVLGPLVVAGWLVVAFVARAAVHTGWLYYDGGDESWYYTSAWMLGHGQLPYSAIGYGYSIVLGAARAARGAEHPRRASLRDRVQRGRARPGRALLACTGSRS